MRKWFGFVVIIYFLLFGLPSEGFCNPTATGPTTELDWDYLKPLSNDRKIDTVSLHILEKISETDTRSVYRGITITRPYGHAHLKDDTPGYQRSSSAVGIGPTLMVRNEKYRSGKFSAAVDMSGGLILYDKAFPAGGRSFDFMWRIGPQLIYKFDQNSSLNIGYMFMHVSDGFKTHNPSYNAKGISAGFVMKF